MRGYIFIPESVSCRTCKFCGSRPIISMTTIGEYVVKCPISDNHYQTRPGIIDIEDWNAQNIPLPETELEAAGVVACYDSKLNYTFFLPAF